MQLEVRSDGMADGGHVTAGGGGSKMEVGEEVPEAANAQGRKSRIEAASTQKQRQR